MMYNNAVSLHMSTCAYMAGTTLCLCSSRTVHGRTGRRYVVRLAGVVWRFAATGALVQIDTRSHAGVHMDGCRMRAPLLCSDRHNDFRLCECGQGQQAVSLRHGVNIISCAVPTSSVRYDTLFTLSSSGHRRVAPYTLRSLRFIKQLVP